MKITDLSRRPSCKISAADGACDHLQHARLLTGERRTAEPQLQRHAHQGRSYCGHETSKRGMRLRLQFSNGCRPAEDGQCGTRRSTIRVRAARRLGARALPGSLRILGRLFAPEGDCAAIERTQRTVMARLE